MNAPAQAWAARGQRFSAAGVGSRVWSEGDGEPVVCLHGVPASSFIYRKLLVELASRGRRGVAFDFPGLGLAERPAGFDYAWSSLAAWTVAALDALGLERVHLVVHDIGGPIGFDVARRIPDRILSLTALNTFARVASFQRPWPMEPFAHRGVGELWLRSMNSPMFAFLMRRIGVATRVPADELQAYVDLLKRGDGGRAFLRVMRSFERTPEFEAGIVAALRERRYPAQVIWGEGDPALRVDRHGEEVREVLGADRVLRLPGRHWVMEDAPAEIAGHVVTLTP